MRQNDPIPVRPSAPRVARLQPVRCGRAIRYVVLDESGMALAFAPDHALARTLARLLGREPVSVH